MQTKFPLYIPSKGRWETRLTVIALERMKCPYNIIVEEQEYEQYKKVIDPKYGRILILDKSYQKDYDACMELKDDDSRGSGPARNFAWEHSISEGHKFHWVMDDNISNFIYHANNKEYILQNGKGFRLIEEFIQCYDNMAMCGPEYVMFVPRKQKVKPMTLNVRLFSCNLIRNDVPLRWRGRYNEDICLSLDMLKKGYCTSKFLCVLQEKMATQTIKGGNNTEIYAAGTLDKSKLIVKIHPDCCKLAWRYGREHHTCHYQNGKLRLNQPIRNDYKPEKIEFNFKAKDKK